MSVEGLTHIDLFSGIGGFALAARWAGIETVQFVEIDKFCQKVLAKNFKDVPIHDDIKTFKYSGASPFILTGGVPCQPASCAGKRKGKEDDRWLWPEAFRIVSEVKPEWCLFENVAGLLSLEGGLVFDNLLAELEGQGYEVWPVIIPACAVNAPHRRDRVWIVAHGIDSIGQSRSARENERGMADENKQTITYPIGARTGRNSESPCDERRRTGEGGRASIRQGNGQISTSGISSTDRNAAHPCNPRLQGSEWPGSHEQGQATHGSTTERNHTWDEPWIEAATRLCGIFNGLSERMDRNGGLNAKTSNAITGQDMPCLWNGFQSESFQWSSGRFNTVQQKENVFAVLWQYFRKSHRQDNLPFESTTVKEAFLRNMWSDQRPGCSPQRWEYNEQYAGEHRDALSSLSHEVALEAAAITERYGGDRVNRLKALGNAIVPAVVFQIMKSIIEVETGGNGL